MHPLVVVAALFTASSLPKSASIVPPQSGPAWAMGNVRVEFADHHAELWTREGRAMMPAVSSTGLVGWAVVTMDNELGMHLDNELRVCWPDGHHRDFPVEMPFIEKWKFSPDGSTVILQFRGTHGPENFAQYEVTTGIELHEALGMVNDEVPDWAKSLGKD
jgi:hypothetical protein